MAFPPGFLDEIKARVSLVDIVGRRVQLRQKSRGDFWGLSPFNTEKTPSFHVREDQGFYHCFATGEHGDLFTFLMKTEGLSFPEAVEQMAELAGLEVPKATPEQAAREKKRHSLYEVVEAACQYFQKALRRREGREALDYLKGRELSDETIAEFRLGFAPPDAGGLWQVMKDEGVEMDLLVEAGLYRRSRDGRPPYAFFRDRIMFPIADRRGRMIAFGGRFMGDAKAAGVGKYINSPDTPLFDKGRTLYNHANARKAAYDGQPLIVAEGYMDVIALSQAGWAGGVAPLGTAMTEMQIAELWKMDAMPYVCFDGDAAGRLAASRASDRALPQLKPGKSMRLLFMPEGQDPDSLIQAKGPDAIRPMLDVAQPLVDFLWQRELAVAEPNTPEMRADLEQRLFALANSIEDETVKKHYRRAFGDKIWNFIRSQSKRTYRYGANNQGRRVTLSGLQQDAVIACLVLFPTLMAEYEEQASSLEFTRDLRRVFQKLQEFYAMPDFSEDADFIKWCSGAEIESIVRHLTSQKKLVVYGFSYADPKSITKEKAKSILKDILDVTRSAASLLEELLEKKKSGQLSREDEEKLFSLAEAVDRFESERDQSYLSGE